MSTVSTAKFSSRHNLIEFSTRVLRSYTFGALHATLAIGSQELSVGTVHYCTPLMC